MKMYRVLAATVVLIFAPIGRATLVVPPSFEQLVGEADIVIRGTVSSVRCEWKGTAADRRIVTLVELRVSETVVGVPQATVELEFLGGEVDGEGLFVAGQPRFAVGNEDILFVSGNRRSFCPLVAMMYGRFLVARAEDGSTVVARENGVPLLSIAEVALPMGEAPTQKSMRAVQQGDAVTAEAFCQAIRDTATRLGRNDVSQP